MPPGRTVKRPRSYVAVLRAASRRAIRAPSITIVRLRPMLPRPSRTVPARIVIGADWPRAHDGKTRASATAWRVRFMEALRGGQAIPRSAITQPRARLATYLTDTTIEGVTWCA